MTDTLKILIIQLLLEYNSAGIRIIIVRKINCIYALLTRLLNIIHITLDARGLEEFFFSCGFVSVFGSGGK